MRCIPRSGRIPLAPRTFTRCMDDVLAPLHCPGIRLVGWCSDRKMQHMFVLVNLHKYAEERPGAISGHSVFEADFRLQENNFNFNLRRTEGNKRVHLSIPSRGESHLGSHSTGSATCSFTHATCTAISIPTRVSSPYALVKEGDGYT